MNNGEQFFNTSGGGYAIERSLRFNSSDSAYLSRTPSTVGNRKTWTWAGWVKRCALTPATGLFSAGSSGTNISTIYFNVDGTLWYYDYINASFTTLIKTSAVYRDFSAWQHIVVSVDTTAGTSSNRVRIYVNGSQVTAFSAATYPSLNADTWFNTTNIHYINREYSTSNYGNHYLADVHFIDGLALDPTSFGKFDANNIWQPKEYTGTYPGNSFHLDFSDNSSAAALGTDTSGNGNTWTVNNLSVAAGAGNDSLVDVPTNGSETDTGVGDEVRGNYCTWNPLKTFATLSNGNLDGSGGGAGYYSIAGTFGVTSGKWYWEVTMNTSNQVAIGVATPEASLYESYGSPTSVWVYYSDGTKRGNGANNAYGASYGAGDVIGVALDMDAGTLVFYKNGVSQGTAFSTGLSGKTIVPWHGMYFSTSSSNFGQRPFAYTAPSGFKALCTANLPSITITTSGSYTGNGVADGPFVYINGVPTAMTIGGNAVTFGTHADKLSNGFKIRTTSTTFNQNASTYNYTITSNGDPFKTARAQSNP